MLEILLKKAESRSGLCLVNAMHITASVFINDNESGLHKDFDVWRKIIVAIANGELDFGP
jgi:thiamine phosphate synthase YjbQ (UPF0047 family)